MSNCYLCAALCGAAATLVTQPARSHEIVGNRMFPATLAIDDPGVADELSLPTVAVSKTGDVPPVKQLDISGDSTSCSSARHIGLVRGGAGFASARRPEPVVHSGLRRRVRSRVGVWLPAGYLAFRRGRGHLGRHSSMALANEDEQSLEAQRRESALP
jgi:hypothetical protein